MPAFRPSFLAWARTLPDGEVYRLDPNGPKPRKIGGVIWNSKIVVFYAVLFTIPSIGALMWTQGKTQLSREQLLQTPTARARMAGSQDPDLAKEKRQQMNAVLFETKDAGKQEWAKKRDAEATKA